ncbi:MAG: cytochrome P450 [Polyangiales bacterium]
MRHSSTRLPPGPAGVPLVGSGPALARDPLGFMLGIARRYGDIASARFGPRTMICLNHPRLVEEVFVGRHRACVKDPTTRELIPLLGHGLLTSEGELWRKQRKLSAPALQPKRIETYASTMSDCTSAMAAGLRDDEVRDIHADVMQLTLEIVGKTLLGFDTRRDGARVSAALEDMIAYFDQRLFSPKGILLQYFRLPVRVRYERARTVLEGLVAQMVERARADSRQDYLLAQLVAAEDEQGERMSDRQACDEAITMLLAGHETTALTITYAIYALSQEPACQTRLRAELDQLGALPPTAADIDRLPYLDAVVREALRLYPPAWAISREVVSPFALAGYEIPAGVELVCSPYALQRDPRFFREPGRFLPERWLETGRAAPPRFAYIPFGAGPRTCIGSHFAKLEAALVLGTLLQQVKLQVVPGYQLELAPVITMRPRHGLPVIVRRLRARDRALAPAADVLRA